MSERVRIDKSEPLPEVVLSAAVEAFRRAERGLRAFTEKLFRDEHGFLPGSRATRRLRKKRRSRMSQEWDAGMWARCRERLRADRIAAARFRMLPRAEQVSQMRRQAEDFNATLRAERAKSLSRLEAAREALTGRSAA